MRHCHIHVMCICLDRAQHAPPSTDYLFGIFARNAKVHFGPFCQVGGTNLSGAPAE